MKKQTESKTKKAILEYLHLNNIFAIPIIQVGIPIGKTNKRIPLQMKGIADIYMFYNHRAVWIEVKSERGRQTEYQKEFQKEVKGSGQKYIIARSIDDIIKYLDEKNRH